MSEDEGAVERASEDEGAVERVSEDEGALERVSEDRGSVCATRRAGKRVGVTMRPKGSRVSETMLG